eukprot:TRINITY_DN8161_c0_g1_i1.p1 TRINITY_DN8161_c0_g1~~TRINITY_DN8161_c0_g1_i1.p1  ORF type:complete len:445 (+),score=53.59 TRINITY_DN8161_c0_g1_i1:98-1432(+)
MPGQGAVSPGCDGSIEEVNPAESGRVQVRPEVQQLLQQLQSAASTPVATSVSSWSTDEVANWVDGLLGAGRGASFREHGVDGPTLLAISDKDLTEVLGISGVSHAKLIGHLRVLVSADRVDGYVSALTSPPEVKDVEIRPDGTPFSSSRRSSAKSTQRRREAKISTGLLKISAGLSPLSSRYSGYTGGQTASTVGLSSFMGLNSPSNSLRGSFAQAPKLRPSPRYDSPGPGAYEPVSAEHTNSKHASPARVTIGTSPRRAQQPRVDPMSPGPHSYSVSTTAMPNSPRPIIGNSPRDTCKKRWDGAQTPPFYTTNAGLLKQASPRVVFGTSPRDCSEFLQTGCEDKAQSTLRSKSPREERRRQMSPTPNKYSTFGTASRDTDKFLTCKQDGAANAWSFPGNKDKACGGVIGCAARFRSESPTAFLQRSPGPHSYRPNPAFSSTFR